MTKSLETKKNQLSAEVNEETLAVLRESYPVEQGTNRIMLPRLGMVSQDQVEGKGKTMKVVTEAGTFFIEKPTEEENENGKKIWERKELGSAIEGVILFQRKQLRMYEQKTEEFTSSPVYDSDDEVLPLFCNKAEVARGTPEELKAKYQYTDKDGKTKSKLEDNRILYVQHEGEIFQMNLRGSSMYSFLTYARKVMPPSVITIFTSVPQEKGTISWNKMMFEARRKITQAEAEEIVARVQEIKNAVRMERAQFVNASVESDKLKKDFDNF